MEGNRVRLPSVEPTVAREKVLPKEGLSGRGRARAWSKPERTQKDAA